MIRLSAAIALVSLAACGDGISPEINGGNAPADPQVEHYIFVSCLELAKGPQTTHYNDRAEVVEECRRTAAWQSDYCPQGKTCAAWLPTRGEIRAILPLTQ